MTTASTTDTPAITIIIDSTIATNSTTVANATNTVITATTDITTDLSPTAIGTIPQ